METTFDVVPDRAYFKIRYVTRNSRGEIQVVGTASAKRFETERVAKKAVKNLKEDC